jgi:hypothetical protein
MGADESTLEGPILKTWPSEFMFYHYLDGPAPEGQILSICNIGTDTLNWEITEDCPWLDVTPISGESSGEVNEVTVSVDVSGLAWGEYNCELTISDPCALNNPQRVDVNLVVRGPTISLSVTKFQFRALKGGANPAEQILSISNVGGSTLNWEITEDCNWLTAEPNSGSSTEEADDVNLCVDIMNLSVGSYRCDLIVSDPNAENDPQVVEVKLKIVPIILDYEAEAYAYSHVENPGSDTDTDQEFTNNVKAEAKATAEAFDFGGGPGVDDYEYYGESNAHTCAEGTYDSNGISIVSTATGWGRWSWAIYPSGGQSRFGSGTGGGSGNGYTSMAGTFTIGNFEGCPQGSHGLTLKVNAEIFGDAPGSWDNWDWWIKIWDDDPNNPLVLLSDINMSVNLDVLAGQVLNFELYHEAGKGSWPEADLGSTIVIDLYLLLPSIADLDNDCDIDFFDYASFAMGRAYGTSHQIPRGSVVVDGDLGDWQGSVEWKELDEVYWGNPNDVSGARFALQWDANTNKVYAVVVVNDTNHLFLDEYVYWDASDRIEVYSQGDAEDGAGWNDIYDVAQQYYVAPDTSDGNWATWAEGETLGGDVGLEYAVDVNGTQIIYEVGVRQFDNYGGFSGGETVVTELHAGHVVGFDIVANTRWGIDEFGMLSENLMMGKYNDAGKFGKYILVDKIFSVDLDGNGENNYADLGIFCESWLWGK